MRMPVTFQTMRVRANRLGDTFVTSIRKPKEATATAAAPTPAKFKRKLKKRRPVPLMTKVKNRLQCKFKDEPAKVYVYR